MSKLLNLTDRKRYFVCDNHKGIIFHLFNNISPLIQNVHGKMKQK